MKELPSILFVTNNAHKLSEVRAMLDGIYQVKSLADVGCHDDIPETADTIDGNAWIKARYAAGRYGIGCIADDTGLEVEALGGEPGVYSARYAGPGHDSAANVAKLLAKLDGVTDRRACFRTVIAAIIDGHEFSVSGRVDGVIAQRPSGCGGFGYDPVFIPDGHQTTFAEMGDDAKNAISHRRRAIQAFVAKLAEINRNQ